MSALFLQVKQSDLDWLSGFAESPFIARCAATVVGILRRASEAFANAEGWFYFSVKKIKAEVFDFFGRDTIRKSLELLLEHGFLKRATSQELGKNGQFHTYWYQLVDARSQVDAVAIASNATVSAIAEPLPKPVIEIPLTVELPKVEPIAIVAPPPPKPPEPKFNDPIADAYKTRSELPPWRSGWGVNGFHPDFVEYIRRWLSGSFGKETARASAVSYISKRERVGSPNYDPDTLFARAEEWKEDGQRRFDNAVLRGEIKPEESEVKPDQALPQAIATRAPVAYAQSAAAYQDYKPTEIKEETEAEKIQGMLNGRKSQGMPLSTTLRAKAIEHGLDLSYWDNPGQTYAVAKVEVQECSPFSSPLSPSLSDLPSESSPQSQNRNQNTSQSPSLTTTRAGGNRGFAAIADLLPKALTDFLPTTPIPHRPENFTGLVEPESDLPELSDFDDDFFSKFKGEEWA